LTSHCDAQSRPDTLTSRASDCLDGLRALQAIQAEYDAEVWDIDEPVHAKVRHIHIHLSTTVGRLASAIEPADHDAFHGRHSEDVDAGSVSRLIADLLMHAGQLANCYGVDLDAALAARYRSNAARFAPDSSFVRFGIATEA
jgi:predicted HAD superfamily Cof-like phosphohydrolase